MIAIIHTVHSSCRIFVSTSADSEIRIGLVVVIRVPVLKFPPIQLLDTMFTLRKWSKVVYTQLTNRNKFKFNTFFINVKWAVPRLRSIIPHNGFSCLFFRLCQKLFNQFKILFESLIDLMSCFLKFILNFSSVFRWSFCFLFKKQKNKVERRPRKSKQEMPSDGFWCVWVWMAQMENFSLRKRRQERQRRQDFTFCVGDEFESKEKGESIALKLISPLKPLTLWTF